METPSTATQLLGKFEPADSKRILSALEENKIPFELAADHSELVRPGRTANMILGTYPDGSKLAIFVPEAEFAAAQQALYTVFPELKAAAFKPENAPTVSPYLVVDGADQTISFLHTVFGATTVRRYAGENGRVMHAEIRIADSVVMIADAASAWPAVPAHVHVYVPNVDDTYRRALEAGAVSVQAPVKKEDEDKRGGIKDAGGTTWWIATKVA